MVDRVSFEGVIHAGKKTATKMAQHLALPGDIVVSKIRARQGSIGLVTDATGPVSVTIHYRVLTPDTTRIDAEFLWHALRSSYGKGQFLAATGGAMKGEISEQLLLKINIPLPPLATQRAIVAEWHKAQKAIADAEEKAKAIEGEIERQFLNSLGLGIPVHESTARVFAISWQHLERWGVDVTRDSVNRPTLDTVKYPVVRLSDVVSDLENGWSPKCLPQPATDDEWGVLKLGAVSFGEFNAKENKALPTGTASRPQYEIKEGDLLISRANITRLVGACALVEQTRPRLLLCDKIFRAVWNPRVQIHKPFLAMVLKTPHVRWQIENNVTGASPTMKNITKTNLLALRFPLPPLAVQQEIMKNVASAQQMIDEAKGAADKIARRIEADMEAYLLGRKKVPAFKTP